MAYFTGENVRIGVAINAETDGCTWDGTPGDYDFMKLATGGAVKVEVRNSKSYVEELDVDPRDVVVGGLYYTITMDLVLSYSYREKLFQLIAGGAIATAGAGPYTHSYAKADKLLFGSLKLEYADQCADANTYIYEVFDNFCVNSFAISESPEGYATFTVSGLSNAMTRTTTNASLDAVNHSEPCMWSHLTVSADGTTTYHMGDISFEITSPLTEGDFAHAATTPATLDHISRNGFRETKWGFTLLMDADAYSLIENVDAVWDGANSYAWNNGAAAAANRQLTITMGNSYMEGRPDIHGTWGVRRGDVSLMAVDGTTPSFDFEIINGRATIPA